MPIFEYICKECDHQFETIVHGSTLVRCPSCSGRKLEKQLSNTQFVERAPTEKVAELRQRVADIAQRSSALEQNLEAFA